VCTDEHQSVQVKMCVTKHPFGNRQCLQQHCDLCVLTPHAFCRVAQQVDTCSILTPVNESRMEGHVSQNAVLCKIGIILLGIIRKPIGEADASLILHQIRFNGM